jgi:hypothetical protein
MKRREDCEKRSEIMEEAYYYREDENEKKGIIPSYSSST